MSKNQVSEMTKIRDLRDMLRKSVKTYGDQTAVSFQNSSNEQLSTRTYHELAHDVASLGTAYLELAGHKSLTDKVALISENRYEWITTYLAVVNSGRIIVPIDKELTAVEISNLLDRCKAKTVIFSEKVCGKIAELKKLQPGINNWINLDASTSTDKEISWWDLLADGSDMLSEGNPIFNKQDINPHALCTLIFTSGTTGKPKGVMLSHQNLSSDAVGFCQALNFTKETILSVLPLNHSFAAMCEFISQLYRGSHLYFLPGGLRELAAQLQIAKPTVLFAVPLIVEGSYKRALSELALNHKTAAVKKAVCDYFGGRLNRIVVGGAPMNPAFIAKYDAINIPVLHGYGLTESSPVVAVNPVDNRVDSSIGLPLPNVTVKIKNNGEDGVGELLVKGPMVMLGYYKDKVRTDQVFDKGWLCTGDLGFINETGHIHITGRAKNVILGKNGKNVYPEELERLVDNLAFVSESMVYGEIKNDDVVVAVLVIPDKRAIHDKLGAYSDKLAIQLIKDEIKELNKTLPKHKIIAQTHLGEALPRTSTGKVKRT